MPEYFDQYARDYDRIQPVKTEMYRFYHKLALDLIPFEPEQPFTFVDLGCGTGNFLKIVLERFTASKAFAVDLSPQMLSNTEEKLSAVAARTQFIQHDLNAALPKNLIDLDMVVAFSALHHLPDDRKRTICDEVYAALKPGGSLLLVDAMYVPYSRDVWHRGRERENAARSRRFEQAGIEESEFEQHDHARQSLDETSPERDRISTLDEQMTNLRTAGFSEIDHVWHFWMEHLVVARK